MNYTGTFFNDIVHLLYPEICSGCGSDMINGNNLICNDCESGMPLTGFHLHAENPVEKIFRGRLPVVSATAYAYFTKDSVVQNMLHSLKYRGSKDIGLKMGSMIGAALRSCKAAEDLDAIVPLPLHFSKQKKRGYNQAEIIGEGISEVLNVPLLTGLIARRKNTATQTRKSRIERWNNIDSKFELKYHEGMENKHVLLVDDVITTGATLEACGSEILKIEGLRLSIAAFAYTLL